MEFYTINLSYLSIIMRAVEERAFCLFSGSSLVFTFLRCEFCSLHNWQANYINYIYMVSNLWGLMRDLSHVHLLLFWCDFWNIFFFSFVNEVRTYLVVARHLMNKKKSLIQTVTNRYKIYKSIFFTTFWEITFSIIQYYYYTYVNMYVLEE